MSWNWELPNWPKFQWDFKEIAEMEKRFLLHVGSGSAFVRNLSGQDYHRFVVEILSLEGIESSRIEGEILDRESLQSSIRQHFHLQNRKEEEPDKESQMAKLLCDVYEAYNEPLTHEMLLHWHSLLFSEPNSSIEGGKYRAHEEPMQIVSNRYGTTHVFFEAPPSARVFKEMEAFIEWFNHSQVPGSILARAAIAHLYLESIHPFEDGNGRIGRILVEKVLSQGVERPILIAASKVLEKRKKEYYAELEKCNRTLEAQDWVCFFAGVVLEAQEQSMQLLYFLIEKSKLLAALSGDINPRQEKVLLRMFAEGPAGFKGGLSAENYMAMTKTSRATATRDLADLVEKGALIKTGELRHTRYWLNLKERP